MIVKDINIKNRSYYFINDIISIKDFGPDIIKIDEKSNKHILIHQNGYFQEINENKYLALVPTNESKEKIKKIWRSME